MQTEKTLQSSVGPVDVWQWGTKWAYSNDTVAGEGFASFVDALKDFARRTGATFGKSQNYNVEITGKDGQTRRLLFPA